MRIPKLAILGMTVLVIVAVFLSVSSPVAVSAQAPAGITDTPTPTPTFTPTPITSPQGPPVVPEASTLILLGSAASGLAGYVGLQIRARRHRS